MIINVSWYEPYLTMSSAAVIEFMSKIPTSLFRLYTASRRNLVLIFYVVFVSFNNI